MTRGLPYQGPGPSGGVIVEAHRSLLKQLLEVVLEEHLVLYRLDGFSLIPHGNGFAFPILLQSRKIH